MQFSCFHRIVIPVFRPTRWKRCRLLRGRKREKTNEHNKHCYTCNTTVVFRVTQLAHTHAGVTTSHCLRASGRVLQSAEHAPWWRFRHWQHTLHVAFHLCLQTDSLTSGKSVRQAGTLPHRFASMPLLASFPFQLCVFILWSLLSLWHAI